MITILIISEVLIDSYGDGKDSDNKMDNEGGDTQGNDGNDHGNDGDSDNDDGDFGAGRGFGLGGDDDDPAPGLCDAGFSDDDASGPDDDGGDVENLFGAVFMRFLGCPWTAATMMAQVSTSVLAMGMLVCPWTGALTIAKAPTSVVANRSTLVALMITVAKDPTSVVANLILLA